MRLHGSTAGSARRTEGDPAQIARSEVADLLERAAGKGRASSGRRRQSGRAWARRLKIE